ncbi:glycosyl transferase [Amylibacter marinus]|uniref:Peptide O-xylosyltransferase n=1 Tax=Amylibacter marinus TaxID=1475483 RepID=A0ABQ5VUW8_9RHOB|nr:DUF5928 domain-containing protein [Amylibacter marinus]GLQ35232.1 glycosyl transferase [Amylibacter marinus]
MANVAYIILCHQNADNVCNWLDAYLEQGCFAAVHFDRNGSDSEFAKLQRRFGENPNVILVPRIKCGWGEWSLVQASLNALKMAEKAFPKASHFYLLSGDCAPIKPANYISDFLDQDSKDYVEHHDFVNSGWIKTGIVLDRLQYRHFFNERKSKRLFYTSLRLQRLFGLARRLPADLDMKIGSQWWCLRRKTVESVLDYTKKNPSVVRFFKTTWIPDECFFQTLVANLIPQQQLVNSPPTYLKFSDYGLPVTFHQDHFDYLVGQDRLFARKITNTTDRLREMLTDYYRDPNADVSLNSNGDTVYNFLVQSGRNGNRFARRFWENGQTVGREKKLSIILCKDWHHGQRVLQQILDHTNAKGFQYLFNDGGLQLPDLGGIEQSVEKRSRHRRAVMRLLFEDSTVDHLFICIDPSSKFIVDDFYSDECTVRTLHVSIPFSDEFCKGHAQRTGVLADPDAPDAGMICQAVKMTLTKDVADIHAAHYSHFYEISHNKPYEENQQMLAGFLERNTGVSDKILQSLEYSKQEA